MEAHAARVTIGEAIREVRGSMPQTQLAAAVGTDQGTISKWENGGLDPDFDDLPLIEKACGVPKGTILRRAGYVDELKTLDDFIETSIARGDRDLVKAAIADALKGGR